MARIPDDELERLKREVSVERLVQAKGIELKRHGADLIGRCPFHDDRTPSLVVSPAKNLWHCMGACQIGGSAIDWVMKAEGVSFRHAVELLKNDAPALAANAKRIIKHATIPKLGPVLERDVDDEKLLAQVTNYYHVVLTGSPEAQEYLRKRGIANHEAVKRFKLGYADRTLGYRLPAKNREDGKEIRGRLAKLGILRESGHEHFRGSLVIPILNDERVLGMYGRKIHDNLRDGTAYHLYLPGPHRGVWNREALTASEDIILCEALIDALTFWCAGFRNVTSTYGVSGITDDLLTAFQEHETKRVLIAYDRDDAGDRAAEQLAERLMHAGLECYRVLFPKGMDANDYARMVQPAEKSLGTALRGATWMGKGPAPSVAVSVASTPSTPEPAQEAPSAPPSLAAEPEPVAPPAPEPEPSNDAPAIAVTRSGDELTCTLGDRRWRVRGLAANTSDASLRVNLLCSRGAAFYVDTLDLYAARLRAMYAKNAADELGIEERVVKRDLGALLMKLEELRDQAVREALEPKADTAAMTDTERDEALALLRDPKLTDRILADLERAGVVGEETNKLVGYLAAVSRKLEDPLAVVIQSSSSAGKSALMDAVLAMVPEEERVKYSAMTGQSLFYMGEADLKHKILAIVEEEGAERAAYALKLLQSEGELTIASTGKDPSTGRLTTHVYRVEGPVMIFLTTTAIEIDEELLNRCVVLTVSEERSQTRAIHERQRVAQTLEGLVSRRERTHVMRVHQNAQRLLRPLLVANPFAKSLTFLDAKTRSRRDHMKYLTLIRAIALLHQHQRPVKTTDHRGERLEYIEVTESDIALANRLATEVLARSRDELPPQTRRLLGLVGQMVRARAAAQSIAISDVRFTRREVREHVGWSLTQTRVHLDRLVALEYVAVHRGSRGASFVYELMHAEADTLETLGLAETGALIRTTTNLAGDGGQVAAGVRGSVSEQKTSASAALGKTSRPDGITALAASPARASYAVQ
jgi:DNA primase catalytic core